MLWIIIAIGIFIVLYYSLPLILMKNEWINKKININITKRMLGYFYGISAFFTVVVILVGITINTIATEKTVQAVQMNSEIKGINISNNDGQVDLASVSEAGGQYVYLKATEGATFKDSYMDTYYKKCKSLGMKVGVYHYLVSTSTPEEQADNFYQMISNYDWDLIPILDVEVYFDGLEDYIKRFDAEFTRLSSLKLGIYSYTSFINKYLNDADSEIYDMPLWEANYNGQPWNGVGNNNFKHLIGHQYSTKEHISEFIGDFNGDINEFNEAALISADKE